MALPVGEIVFMVVIAAVFFGLVLLDAGRHRGGRRARAGITPGGADPGVAWLAVAAPESSAAAGEHAGVCTNAGRSGTDGNCP